MKKTKQLSNPFSTGGGGIHFENSIQTSFAVLMFTRGVFPCLSPWPIVKIKLQGKYQGFETDDLIVYSEQPGTNNQAKMLGQIKHSLSITDENKEFREVIQAAWYDFNNKKLFNEETDIIALICGPLSASNTNDVRQLLNHARASESSEDFIKKINLTNFASKNQRTKLQAFKAQLKVANENVELTNDQLWQFLKVFHLFIYDLDIKGVTLSFLHTIIEQYACNNSDSLWNQIKGIVEWENQNAGFITVDSAPEEIRSVFKSKQAETIPEKFIKDNSIIKNIDWTTHRYAHEIAIACLIGSWDEKSDEDKFIVSKIAQEDYKNWISKLRELLQESGSPVTLKNGIWSIQNRKELWEHIGTMIFDKDIDCFKESIVSVLIEPDPKFELDKNLRFSAGIYGKVLKHSNTLRISLSEGLALIGACSKALINCSKNKAEYNTILSIREIFNNANWVLWASLNNLLPLLAEASPSAFLDALEKDLSQTHSPFVEIFAQEGDGITGGNYMTGLLWGLESLAWEEELLTRVTVVLGELANLDPGGKWSNRPINSLTNIFLPWFPQTLSPIDKRKVAIKTLNDEIPNVAWELLINLLPKMHQTTSGSSKPKFRDFIPKDWVSEVTNDEYLQQVSFYTNFLIEQAKNNIKKLEKLVEHLDTLPMESFDKMLMYLSEESIISIEEKDRLKLWNKLITFIARHEYYAHTDWALKPAIIEKIKNVADMLKPKNPINLYSRLFNGRAFDLYEEDEDGDDDNWQKKAERLYIKRQNALKIILGKNNNINEIFKLLTIVESSSDVGWALGTLEKESFDKHIIPDLLTDKDEKLRQFATSYISSTYNKKGWDWVDTFKFKEWSTNQIANFFVCLPFTKDNWLRINKISINAEKEYWGKAGINPYEKDTNLNFAIEKLIQHNRPNAAIECIHRGIDAKIQLDNTKIIQALDLAVSSSEFKSSMDIYHIVEIIKYLQNEPTINEKDLIVVEWQYLAFLDEHNKAEPKTLEYTLANDAGFFCEVIRSIYRSKKEPDKQVAPSESAKMIMENAWNLLSHWHTPPGTQKDGSFNEEKFLLWLEETKRICTESGHLEVALTTIGKVLFYCPPDGNGFWINKTVANVLNEKEAEDMREGFYLAVVNSRGMHFVDPTAAPEKTLAAKYKQQAEDTENECYHRLAQTLKKLSDSYIREAEDVINELANR